MKAYKKVLAYMLAFSMALSFTLGTGVLADETETETETEDHSVAIDKDAFDELIASGIVADDETIAASEWATAV
ncbi:MAG: hypothetical protein LIP11_05595 [Clostridiales bacterium]|nr:hypothetical protein [Clostridiales bacterium]